MSPVPIQQYDQLYNTVEDVFSRFSAHHPVVMKSRLRDRLNALFDSLTSSLKKMNTLIGADILDSLHGNASKKRPDNIHHDLLEKYNKIMSGVKHTLDNIDEPFLLFVIGLGNYGKSTLINALIGKDMAEVHFLPKTWKIDIFEKRDDTDVVVIRHRDGSKLKMKVKEAKAYLQKEEDKRRESEKRIADLVASKKNELPIEELEDYKVYVRNRELFVSEVVEARWGYNHDSFVSDFRIVDTPGLSQTLGKAVLARADEFVQKADGVLWLLDVRVISAAKVKEALEDVRETLKHFEKIPKNMIGVVNRIDNIVSGEEGEEKLAQVLTTAEKHFGKYFRAIIPLSAKLAWESVSKNDREKAVASRIDGLKNQVDLNFKKFGNNSQFESKYSSAVTYGHNMVELMNAWIETLNMAITEFDKRKCELSEFFSSLERQVKSSCEGTINKCRARVTNNISSKTSDLIDYALAPSAKEEKQEAAASFISNNIFDASMFVSEFTECLRVENRNIVRAAKRISDKMVFSAYQHLKYDVSGKTDIKKKEVSISSKVKTQAVLKVAKKSFKSNMLTNLGGLPLIGGLIKNDQKIHVKNNLEEGRDDLCRDFLHDLKNETSRTISETRIEAERILKDSFTDIYCHPDNVRKLVSELKIVKDKSTIDLNNIDPESIFIETFGR